MEFTLRRAAPADLDRIMVLENAGFAAGIVEDREVFARRLEAFPQGFLLADSSGGPALGYLCAELWSGWSLSEPRRFDLGHDLGAWHDPKGSTLYVASMTVAPEWRGTGAGRAMFRASLGRLLDEFPAVREAVLVVNESWAAARSIYLGEGFGEVGRLAGFFRPWGGPLGDAIVMKKETGRD
jgi:ribosomal-protein-alanine N-acetyltransferase